MKRPKYIFEIFVFIGVYFLIVLFVLNYSPFVQVMYAHDIPVVLDGAWRIENGQVPHVDFSSILGYAYLFQQYLFLKLFDYNLIGFSVSSITTTSIGLLIFFALYRSKVFTTSTSVYTRSYVFLLIVALGMGQYNFGIPYDLVTYANLYNRYCFVALLALVLLLITLSGKRTVNVVAAVSLIGGAFILNYLLFTKVTYMMVAAGFIGLLLIFRFLSITFLLHLIIYSIVIFIAVLTFSDIKFMAIIQDYRTIASVRTGIFMDKAFVNSKIRHLFNLAFLGSLLLLMVQVYLKRNFALLLLLAFVGCAAILVHFTNWGEKDIVLLSFVPVLFILPAYSKFTSLFSFKLLVFVSGVFIAKNFLSIYSLTRTDRFPVFEIKNPYVKGFNVSLIEVTCKTVYSDKIMRGVDLVNKNKTANEKVLSFTFENPFPILTHTIPPKHAMLAWQYGTTFSNKVFPERRQLFSDVDLVMIPKCDDPGATLEMRQLYKNELTNSFSKIDEDNYWYLMRKIKPVL